MRDQTSLGNAVRFDTFRATEPPLTCITTTNNQVMKKRLLAVDDQEFILKIIETFLSTDYELVQKQNGKEALNWLQQGNLPDLIIADINMPEVDGYEFIRQIRSSGFFRDIPIIILSGRQDTGDKIEALKAGADDYLVKPFNPAELEVRIASIFRLLNRAR